jgi:uncharacterized ion transporter superfamily protein YfcC
MKAQFATIEAGIALVLVASAVGFASSLVNSSTASLASQSASLQKSIAVYDIFNALERNATYNACIAQLYLGNQTGCVAGAERYFDSVFGMNGIGILIGEQGAGDACATIPLSDANATAEVCISFA